VQPHRFHARGRPNGDAHVYAPRSRFLPESLLALFERPVARGEEVARVDVRARLREMWQ
jgi:DNA helicase-2/ATP-dependent DNA helicase PcrA